MNVKISAALFALLLSNVCIAQSSNCYAIRDNDLKNECLAVIQNNPSKCYAIKNSDLKNSCLAKVNNRKSTCYSIKDKDQKSRCLSDF